MVKMLEISRDYLLETHLDIQMGICLDLVKASICDILMVKC